MRIPDYAYFGRIPDTTQILSYSSLGFDRGILGQLIQIFSCERSENGERRPARRTDNTIVAISNCLICDITSIVRGHWADILRRRVYYVQFSLYQTPGVGD